MIRARSVACPLRVYNGERVRVTTPDGKEVEATLLGPSSPGLVRVHLPKGVSVYGSTYMLCGENELKPLKRGRIAHPRNGFSVVGVVRADKVRHARTG